MNKTNTVNILMSTFNGEKYIEEQINSIIAQKNIDIFLSIRDDGSTDNTIDLIKKISDKHKNLKYYPEENLGYKLSFMNLIYNKSQEMYDFYAFSDQDDIWLESKLETAIKKIGDVDEPRLYFSNCLMVDNKLDRLGLLHKEPLRISEDLNTNIVNGFAHGCTIVFNKSAMKLIKEYKVNYECAHDYWIPLIVNEFGELIYDFEPHILYRQHTNNVFGGKKISFIKLVKNKIKNFKQEECFYSNMAKEILNGYEKRLSIKKRLELELLANYRGSFLKKISLFLKRDVKKNTLRGTLYLKFLILINKF